jgi:hypothetical protein
MLSTIEGLTKDTSDLAGVLNQFKSEAVQVKVLDRLLEMFTAPISAAASVIEKVATGAEPVAPKRRGRPPKAQVAPTKAERRKRKRSAMGATGALHALLAQGYFKKRHTISEIVEACQSKLGVAIKVTNLSGPLGKFVDEKKLLRAKNKDGRFEYWGK